MKTPWCLNENIKAFSIFPSHIYVLIKKRPANHFARRL